MGEDTDRRVPLFTPQHEAIRPTIVDLPPRAPSDLEQAASFRLRALEALEQLNGVCSEADRSGFVIAYSTGQDGLGRYIVQQFRILKKMG